MLIVEDDPFVSDALIQTFNGRMDAVVAVGSDPSALLAASAASMARCCDASSSLRCVISIAMPIFCRSEPSAWRINGRS